MLKKSLRLPGGTRFSSEKTLTTNLFILRIARNNLAHNRYGFVVSKRIDKRAVQRNRLKRLLRAGIEELETEIKKGFDMLFIPKSELADCSKETFMNTLQASLQKQSYL